MPPRTKIRVPERKRMTLVNGFRCRTGGILLCADREEDDGYNKREVDKIVRIPCTLLQSCDIFLAASGSSDLMKRFEATLIKSLVDALAAGIDIVADHQSLLESELAAFYKREGVTAIKKAGGLVYIIVVAPFSSTQCPLMYRSNKTQLIPEPFYCSTGTGQPIADYFADRLFHYDRMDKATLAVLAAFILREAEASASGVGLGNDMVFIHDKGNELHFIYKDKVKELQSGIPKLEDSINAHWTKQATIPSWINT